MKKPKIKTALLSVMVCFTLMFLTGCSCGGDFVNCFTNGFASIFDWFGCIASSTCAKCTVSCATCGFCGGFCGDDCGVYDCMTGFTCSTCAEQCRSYTVGGDGQHLITASDKYSLTTVNCSVASAEKIYSVKYDTGYDNYYKIVGDVSFRLDGEASFDNVRVVCTLSYRAGSSSSDTTIESTRWVGTVKADTVYSVEPTFYVCVSSSSDFNGDSVSSYGLTYKVYGG